MRRDRVISNAVRIKSFILENFAYDQDEGVIYMRGIDRVRVPIEPDNDRGKRPRIRIGGQAVLAAHVAFIIKTKNWPEYPIKHLNGDEADIRWDNMVLTKADVDDEEQKEALAQMANDKFLADLRRYHPKGPPTYQIKSSGKVVTFHRPVIAPNGFGGGPSAMLADF